MSPEQATADQDLSARSDIYSLACVLYEMLAGSPPHSGPTAHAILMRILTEEPRPVTDIDPRWSPDGSTLVYSSGESGNRQIYTYNVDLGTIPRQLTFEGNNRYPVWSPDGMRIAFSSTREGSVG